MSIEIEANFRAGSPADRLVNKITRPKAALLFVGFLQLLQGSRLRRSATTAADRGAGLPKILRHLNLPFFFV